jgi:DNA polymerase (family 10)
VLGIDSLSELEAAAHDGRLTRLPRFGPRTSETILKGIAFLRQASAYRLFHHAIDEAEGLRAALERLPGVTSAMVAGDVRRRTEVVRELVFVLIAESSPADLFRRLSHLPGVHEFAGQDERRLTLRFAGGASAHIVATTPVNAGAVLVQATGNEAHLRELTTWAGGRGFALNGAALWRGSQFVATPDETTFYQALGLGFIPPELREGRGEVAAAAQAGLPRLIEKSDLRGFLHCHTSYSDGHNTVEELALACKQAGYDYLGVTDHSQAASYAGGLRPEDVARQAEEIDQVNSRLEGFRVLKGIEADILQDGSVDYDQRVLERLDFVIGSVHSRFNMGEKEMTARILAAMDNPYLTIIGHPTGRLLLSRDPYPVDLDAVIEKAAATGVALEINGDPHRLDLDWRMLRQARDSGVAISIGADAHSVAGLGYVDNAVNMARKGWLAAGDILNSRSVGDFVAYARRRR